jgi:hypothetical protein
MEALILRIQAIVDRWSRWMRLGPADTRPPRRRFLIIQIDGLSREMLDRALRGDSLRNVRRLLTTGQLARRELSVGLPSSTPAFQASLMYGERPDIPGFHFYDKRERRELHFPKHGVADLVERRHARGRACGPSRGCGAWPARAGVCGAPRSPGCCSPGSRSSASA